MVGMGAAAVGPSVGGLCPESTGLLGKLNLAITQFSLHSHLRARSNSATTGAGVPTLLSMHRISRESGFVERSSARDRPFWKRLNAGFDLSECRRSSTLPSSHCCLLDRRLWLAPCRCSNIGTARFFVIPLSSCSEKYASKNCAKNCAQWPLVCVEFQVGA